MSDYKRLTNQEWSDKIDLTQEYGYQHIYKRLYELETKIENGTLVELACKVGDTVYWITSSHEIVKAVVKAIRIVEKRVIYYVEEHGVGEYTIFDSMLFLTKAEAEAKLEQIKKERV